MVKLPGLDELKKMGSNLIDSAKSVNVGEAVDKLKGKIESMSGQKAAVVPEGGDPVAVALANLSTSVDELVAVAALQASAIKKIQGQLADLAKMIEARGK
jgi:hypothetical protein